MACDISAGRLEPCKDNVGGLDAIYFVNYDDLPSTQITLDVDDQVTAIGGTPTAYKYELKGTSNLETAITSSRDNGTTFFDAILNIMLKKQDLATHKEVKLLSWGRPKIFVKDNNNNYFLVGYEHGADVNGGSIALGHPLGCTGARQMATLLPELKRTNGRYGIISMCIGTGMGAAALIEM